MTEQSRKLEIRNVIESYCKAIRDEDLDAICLLYTEDATIEDPVGTPKKCGMAEIRAFYKSALLSKPSLRTTGDPVIVGDFSATPLLVDLEYNGKAIAIELISIMSYDNETKITSMTACFNPVILDA